MNEYNLPNGSLAIMAGNVSLMETAALTALSPKPSWIAVQMQGYNYCYSHEPSGPEAERLTYLALIHGTSA